MLGSKDDSSEKQFADEDFVQWFYFSLPPARNPNLLAKLYGKRERIENDIRSLKHTLGMEMLYARASEMTQKELVLGVAAYNLLRACLAIAAKKLGLEPRQISFSRGAELTRIFGNKIRLASSQNERNKIIEKYLIALRQSKLPSRTKHRTEPRKVVRNKNAILS